MLSTEAKVGSVVAAGTALLIYMIFYLGGFQLGQQGYPVHAVFGQVNGLKQGNIVRYAGVDIGKVSAVAVAPDGIQVTMLVDKSAQIPVGSKFSIGTDGLLGEKYIDITPAQVRTGVILSGATVSGENIQGLDQMVATADQVLRDVQQLVNSLNQVFGDQAFQTGIKGSMANVHEMTASLNAMSASMARMALSNEGDIAAVVGNLRAMSGNLRDITARVDGLVAGIDNNGQTARDLQGTIATLHSTSVRVEHMAAALEGVVTDPETAQNLKETLKSARSVTQKADKMLNKVSDFSAQAGFEVLYSSDSHKYSTNADVRINTSPRDFAVIGVSDIGQQDKLNLQMGTGTDKLAARAGLVEGKAGLGVDAGLGRQMKLSMDAYDPNDVRVKLRAQYEMAPDLFLVGQVKDVNKSDEQSTYVGVRRSF